MRVLQLHNLHRARGGADEVLEQEGEVLEGAGHQVECFTVAAAEAGGVRAATAAVWNREAHREVSRRIEAFRPDVVHVHCPFPVMSPAVFRAASSAGVPAVTTVHSYRYSCIAGTCLRDQRPCEDCVGSRLKLSGLRHRCYHGSFPASAALTTALVLHQSTGTFSRHVARFIALTDFTARLLVRDGIPAEHVVVKPNAVPDPGPVIKRAEALSYAVFAGRFVEEKGIHTLLSAWRQIGTRLPLRIAGDGPLRGLVEDAARNMPGVDYLGWLDNTGVDRLLRGSDLVVLPSQWYEGQPLVMLKAFAAGRAVLSSDLENIGGPVQSARAGKTFETGKADALAAAVLALVRDPDELRAMGRRARQRYLAAHTPDACLRDLERIYSAVHAEASARA